MDSREMNWISILIFTIDSLTGHFSITHDADSLDAADSVCRVGKTKAKQGETGGKEEL